jgi:hypothetical protein
MCGRLWCGLLCFLLTVGCADYKTGQADQQAAADDAQCLLGGAKAGDPAYLQCKAQLDSARTQAQSITEPPHAGAHMSGGR